MNDKPDPVSFDLMNLDPQRVEGIANACLVAISPFYEKVEHMGTFAEVAAHYTESATAMMVLSVSAFRDLDIDNATILKLMEKICKFSLSQGRNSRFVRVE